MKSSSRSTSLLAFACAALVLCSAANAQTLNPRVVGDAVCFAAQTGNLETLKTLVAEHPDALKTRELQTERTPLHLAAIAGHDEIAAFLLSHNAEVNARDGQLRTPLDYAVRQTDVKTVTELLDAGADPNAPGLWGGNALSTAVNAGGSLDTEVVRALLDNGANIESLDREGNAPLTEVSRTENAKAFAVCELLLKRGARVDPGEDTCANIRHIFSPMEWAIMRRDSNLLRLLIARGADVNHARLFTWVLGFNSPSRDQRATWSAITQADEIVAVPILRILIENGFPVGDSTDIAKYHSGDLWRPPVEDAMRAGKLLLARILFERGASVNGTAESRLQYDAPIFWSMYGHKHTECFTLLKSLGADFNLRGGPDGVTALHLACEQGWIDDVGALIRNGADINTKDNNGKLPADVAANDSVRAVLAECEKVR